jgi:hypothetical protein
MRILDYTVGVMIVLSHFVLIALRGEELPE